MYICIITGLHAPNILEDLKIIIDMGQVVPISFLMDAATMFALRHDVLRVELLIRLHVAHIHIISWIYAHIHILSHQFIHKHKNIYIYIGT
jgi:hypothetical protein